MNRLEFYLKFNQLSDIATINRLQEHGIISDNVVLAKDVSNDDAVKACEWLRKQNEPAVSTSL
jgi:hypothetical protein